MHVFKKALMFKACCDFFPLGLPMTINVGFIDHKTGILKQFYSMERFHINNLISHFSIHILKNT